MRSSLKHSLLSRLRLKESWVIFFIAGIIAMNYPFITIFNKSATLADIPLLFLYLLVGWPISIFVVYLYTRALDMTHENGKERERR